MQAMSASGAAANADVGHHPSRIVEFVMTLFNRRLGWWLPNPMTAAIGSAPAFGFRYVISDLLRGPSLRSRFVRVSDGGRFDNLGIYELVRRRCSVIVASDAQPDPIVAFAALGRVRRLCEEDFDARIDVDLQPLKPNSSGFSEKSCAVGQISYADGTTGGLI